MKEKRRDEMDVHRGCDKRGGGNITESRQDEENRMWDVVAKARPLFSSLSLSNNDFSTGTSHARGEG